MGKERLRRYLEAKANGRRVTVTRPRTHRAFQSAPIPDALDAATAIVLALRFEARRLRMKRRSVRRPA